MDKFVSVSEEAAEKIRGMIFAERRFMPGDRLPNETSLMKELKISRTSLREAIKILIAGKVLYIRRGAGTYVCEFDDNLKMNDGEIFKLFYSADISLVKNSFDIRLILEPELLFQSVPGITVAEIENISQLQIKCTQKILSGEDSSEEDKAFHSAIAHLSNNHVFEKILPYFSVSIANLSNLKDIPADFYKKIKDELDENAVVYHKRIVDCLKDRDPDGSRIAMETHIYNSINIFNRLTSGEDGRLL